MMSSFLCGVVVTVVASALLAPRFLAHLGKLLVEPGRPKNERHIVRSGVIGVALAALIAVLLALISVWLVPLPLDTFENAR